MFLRKKRSRAGYGATKRRRAFILIAGLALLIGIVKLTNTDANSATPQFSVQPDSQFYSEDIVIKAGQVYENDVIVYSGDVQLESGGLIKGNSVC